MFTTLPYDARGYAVGETIGVQVTFSEAVAVSGAPPLRIAIGANAREAEWDGAGTHGAFVAFRYRVTLEDGDKDGVSITADALGGSAGAITSLNGVVAELDIGGHAITDDDDQLVLGRPPQLVCSDERNVASHASPRVVPEWNGTPFPVHIVRNCPDVVSEDYLTAQLGAIGRVAEQIEEQLGYAVLEQGELIDVPVGTPNGWDQDYERYWRTGALRVDPGEIWAIYLNDDNDAWDGAGSPMSAHPCCGTTSYNRRFFRAPHWTQWSGANSPEGEAIVHEVFHLLGFKHYYDQRDRVGVEMSAGGLDRPWVTGSSTYYVTGTDIENLRCIFPEKG